MKERSWREGNAGSLVESFGGEHQARKSQSPNEAMCTPKMPKMTIVMKREISLLTGKKKEEPTLAQSKLSIPIYQRYHSRMPKDSGNCDVLFVLPKPVPSSTCAQCSATATLVLQFQELHSVIQGAIRITRGVVTVSLTYSKTIIFLGLCGDDAQMR
jgi:hypothetical protein